MPPRHSEGAMQRSIRLRLTLWYVAALAVMLLLLGGATYLLTRAGLYHWLDETLAERAEALSEELRLYCAESARDRVGRSIRPIPARQ